ncbi:MAG TPA: hypothetical protein P5105_00805 [Victivallales bacterium]|nr:hypothetical protein [Victivallales bacterium]HPO91009.1 hypothetical protein [Victivallales bacterium]HRR05797.1 hypothetical protein [Victivallales bacterium]HRR28295.1 hypothetical protein [Victivallales bacterium]
MLIDSAQFYKPETITLLWAIIYSSDWLMDWWGGMLYNKKVKEICTFEKGYNIKAISEFEINHGKILFFRYLSELFLTTLFVWLILYSCRLLASWRIYEFFCGMFLILEACMHFRHIRNVAMFTLTDRRNGIIGNIFLPKWISLRFAFTEFSTFSLILLIVFIFDTRNYFVFGGLMASMITAFYHLLLASLEYNIFKEKST